MAALTLPWRRSRAPKEKRSITEAQWLWFNDRTTTKAGANVTTETALYSLAVAACVIARSKAAGTLPAHLYAVDGDRRRKAIERPEYALFKTAWNPHTPASRGWRWLRQTIDTDGNAYVWVDRDKNGITRGFYPITGDTQPVTEVKAGRTQVRGYKNRPRNSAGDWTPLLFANVLHFPSDVTADDGVTGRSLIDVAREAIGLDISSDEFLGSWFKNGTHFGNVLSTEQPLSTEDQELIRDMLKDGKGVAPANKARLFTKGVKPVNAMASLVDADFIAARRYNLERICGVFSTPLPKIQDLEHGTYSNTEQADLAWAKDCVAPMCTDVEQVVNAHLFPDGTRYLKFELNALMRGDFATRMKGFQAAVGAPFMTQNEARGWEDMDPVDGGDELLVPLNMIRASDIEEDATASATSSADEEGSAEGDVVPMKQAASRAWQSRVKLVDQWMPVFIDAFQRIVNRETADVTREVKRYSRSSKRSGTDLIAWLSDYYHEFGAFHRQQFDPVLKAYAAQVIEAAGEQITVPLEVRQIEEFLAGYGDRAAAHYTGKSLAKLSDVIERADPDRLASDVETFLGEWQEGRAALEARRQTVESSQAIARKVWRDSGITKLVWQTTSSNPCDICDELDGVVVGIEEPFASDGQTFGSYTVSGPRFHPPLHGSCQCVISPE